MRRSVKGWKTGGHERRLDARIVNHADDFVICCRGTAEGAILAVDELIGPINRKLRGWSNYFRIGTVYKAYRSVDSHIRYRVRRWLCAKFKVSGNGKRKYADAYLHRTLGLHQLTGSKPQRFVCERVRIA